MRVLEFPRVRLFGRLAAMSDKERVKLVSSHSPSTKPFRRRLRVVVVLVLGALGVCLVICGLALYESLRTNQEHSNSIGLGPKTTAFVAVPGFYFSSATVIVAGTDVANRTRLYACTRRPHLEVVTVDERLPRYDELFPEQQRTRYLYLNTGSTINVSFCAPNGLRVLVYTTPTGEPPLFSSTFTSHLLHNRTIDPSNCTHGWVPNGYVVIEAKKDDGYQIVFLNDYSGPNFVVKDVYNITLTGFVRQYRVADCSHSCVPMPKSSFYTNCSVSLPFTSSAGVVVDVGAIPGSDITDKLGGNFVLTYEPTNRLRNVLAGSIFPLGALLIVGAILIKTRPKSDRKEMSRM